MDKFLEHGTPKIAPRALSIVLLRVIKKSPVAHRPSVTKITFGTKKTIPRIMYLLSICLSVYDPLSISLSLSIICLLCDYYLLHATLKNINPTTVLNIKGVYFSHMIQNPKVD